MYGDCSIRVDGLGFSPAEIDACVQRTGLLAFELELPATAECNSVCCQSGSGSPQPALTLEEIQKLIDQAAKLGCQRVILVDSDRGPCSFLNQIITELRGHGMDVEHFANSDDMPPEQAQFHFDQRVSISLELASLERGPQTAETIAVLDRLHGVGFGSAQGPGLAIRISVDNDNLVEIPAIWRWARSRGIDPLVQIITPDLPGVRPLRLIEPERSRQLFEELGRIDHDEFARTWELPSSLTGRSCKRHQFACHVTSCGTIFACVGVTIPLGNIRIETLEEILSASDVLENLREYRRKVKEPCGSCCKTTDCYGCRGAAYQLTGDYLAGDQMCWKSTGIHIPKLPLDVGDIIPHGPSIRMVDRLLQIGERRAYTDFTIPMDSRWLDASGRFDDCGYIEMIAQSFAATHGYHFSNDGSPLPLGLLLGVKDLVISNQARAGDHLIIHIFKTARFGDFGIIDGTITHEDGRTMAAGQIKIWGPDNGAMNTLKGMFS